MDNSHSNRLKSFDVLKGFIIFAIVMLHLIYTNHSTYGHPALYLQILFIGLMSFFIMSGYFYRPNKGFIKNIGSRSKQLIIATAICTIVLSAILFVWLFVFGNSSNLDDYILSMKWGFGVHNAFGTYTDGKIYPLCGAEVGYYFLWAMMVAFLIFYGLADYVMDSKWKSLAVVIVLLVITFVWAEFVRIRLPFFADLAPMGAALMFAGAWLAKLDIGGIIEGFEYRTKKFWLPFLICLVCGLALMVVFNPDTNFDTMVFGYYGGYSAFPYFIEAVCMVVVYLYIALFVSKIPLLGTTLSFIGKHTLGLLLLHGFVAKMLIIPFWTVTNASWFPTDMVFTERVVIGLATVIICLLICHFGPIVVQKIRDKRAESSTD